MMIDACLKHIDGHLFPNEGLRLLELAETWVGDGAVVEIGSFKGLSTAYLALGCKRGERGKVYAVDHFRGSPEHSRDADIQREGTTYPVFVANIGKAGLSNWVHPIVGSSGVVGERWCMPIRLLFIDGDHEFDGVSTDFDTWYPHVQSGGAIAFHDYTNMTFPAVKEFIDEHVMTKMTLISQTDSLIVFQK